MYLTAGNFPSRAANTIQVAKMAAAYTRWLPNLEVVALTGPVALLRDGHIDLCKMFGLSRPLGMRYLPLLWFQTNLAFGQDYRPPAWFYALAGHYARLRKASLVFTRKPQTAAVTVRWGLDTVLETHTPWAMGPWHRSHSKLLRSSHLRSLVVISRPVADSFLRVGVPPDKILVEPDGVDMDQFTPPIDKVQARQNLGLDSTVTVCVYSGHLYPERGIEDILEAAGFLSDVHFLFVGGWDNDVERHQEIARSRGLTNVTFRGYVPQVEVPSYLFAGDILLMPYSASLPTASRCSPLKMFEYMAAGRPIISSDLPGLRSVLYHNKNALLTTPDSVVELVQAIRRIVKSPRLAELLSRNARRDSQQYSWEERACRVLDHALGGN